METYIPIIVKYPSNIKIGDIILFNNNLVMCKVIAIKKGKRHSREDGYCYTFTGQKNNIFYKRKCWKELVKYIHTDDSIDKLFN